MTPDWQRALCSGLGNARFYPTRGDDTRAVQAFCAECPIRQECADYALHHELWGTWGGTSERERKRERRRLGIALETPTADPWEATRLKAMRVAS